MTRIAHYVRSSHWDREWYEPMQGFRIKLVTVLDGVLEQLARDPDFRYTMDGQSIPITDYLEVRPERMDDIRRYATQGRLLIGPWYVQPDEWLVSGESLVRNLEMGIAQARSFGGEACLAGLLCDQFGHIGQMPQILQQFNVPAAYIWRGTSERKLGGHFIWQSPDGTRLPTYRFGKRGYGMLAYRVRNVFADEGAFDPIDAAKRLVQYTLEEAARSPLNPILLYDGADHMDVEPRMAETILIANKQLAADGIHIVASDPIRYQQELLAEVLKIDRTVIGELRETSGDLTEGKPDGGDEQWFIGGTYASRIHLKQRNAACEDELCLWAEPFCTFASDTLGMNYPGSLLNIAWRHLLENHPHDSMCGCSTDQVHRDMIYRFDQSMAISSRLANSAMQAITIAATDSTLRPAIGLFNATAETIDEPIDFAVYLPNDWPTKFAEFFGFEQKFSFRLRGPEGEEIPYQLLTQRRDVKWRRSEPYKLSYEGSHHQVNVCARVRVPAFGYTTLHVEPFAGPTRYSGSMATSHRSIENELIFVTVNPNGTLRIQDKRTQQQFDQLLTFEERADIGNGWFHGIAANDEILSSIAVRAAVSLIADGRFCATLRISLTMDVPDQFDFRAMRRAESTVPLKIISDVTLRSDSARVEVRSTVHNEARDHRIRVLFPTGLRGDTFEADSIFDVVRHPIQRAPDNDTRRELDLETKAQVSWTAFGDGHNGLAIVARGLPEVAVIDNADRAIALTLLRGTRKVISQDDDQDGQVLGTQVFRYDIVPFTGPTPIKQLFLFGQRLHSTVRQTSLPTPIFPEGTKKAARLPRSQSFISVDGDAIITSIRKRGAGREIRMFNPHAIDADIHLNNVDSGVNVTLDGRRIGDAIASPREFKVPPKHIVTVRSGVS